MTNRYKRICSPCGNYLGIPTTGTSTYSEGQCVNCGRMEPVTELRDFGYPETSQDSAQFKLNWDVCIYPGCSEKDPTIHLLSKEGNYICPGHQKYWFNLIYYGRPEK